MQSLCVLLMCLLVLASSGTAKSSSPFSCSGSRTALECVCTNKDFTSRLCTYLGQVNSSNFNVVTDLLSSRRANITLFAVNNSAYEAWSDAEQSYYETQLDSSLKYLVVNQTYSLPDLQAKPSFALTTLDGPSQLILVNTAGNTTVLNDNDDCKVSLCELVGQASVCLVQCVLAPTNGLGTIAIIGIIVAGVAAGCLIVACLFNIFRKDPDSNDDRDTGYQGVDDGE